MEPRSIVAERGEWPLEGLEPVDRCPICNGTERELLYGDLTDGICLSTPGVWRLYKCTDCGGAYLNPRPNQETIGSAYSEYFTHDPIDLAPRTILRRFKRRLRNGYLNQRFGYSLKPASSLGRYLVPLLAQRRRIDALVRHLSWIGDGGRLIDIGCGNGYFISLCRELGWEAWGIDFDPKALESARHAGATVIQGGIPNPSLPTAYFDVVTLSHVIEHLDRPRDALVDILRILKPGGMLWVATPNLESVGHARFRRSWRGLEPPRHLALFTFKSLSTLLLSTGYEAVERKPCVPEAKWFFQESAKIENRGVMRARGGRLSCSDYIRALVADVRTTISPNGCENIILTARKASVDCGEEERDAP